ncbi:methyltransferase domain-containing protein [Endothiovibrio diazotrophicus]
MATKHFRRSTCRLCGSPNVELVVKLEPIPVAENYCDSEAEGKAAERYPVDLYMCGDCRHVQQLDVLDCDTLWADYSYHSGHAKGMPEHFEWVVNKVLGTYGPKKSSLVVDVGSNDGSMLRFFKNAGYEVLGIDPAVEIANAATASGIETIPSGLTGELASEVVRERGRAGVVCAFNSFAHVDDLGAMTDAIRSMTDDDGVFIFEAQYLRDVVEGLLVGTIFHEHMSHHSVIPMIAFLDRHGLELIDVEKVAVQHGSIIGTAQVKGGARTPAPSVKAMVEAEREFGLDKPSVIADFGVRLSDLRLRASGLLSTLKRRGEVIAGYGAARSGPTLISQLGLAGILEFVVDDHPQKVGKYTSGDGLEILPTAALLERMPKYTVILAWVHEKRIIENNKEYMENGGHFVVLCPELKVVGIDGVEKY